MKNRFNKKTQIGFGLALMLVAIVAFFFTPELGAGIVMASIPVWGVVAQGTFKELSVEEIGKLSPEDQSKYFADKAENTRAKLVADFEKSILEKTKNLLTQQDVDTLVKNFEKGLDDKDFVKSQTVKDLEEKLKAQGVELRKLTENQKPTENISFKESVRNALKDGFEKLKEFHKASRNGIGAFEIQIKAPAIVTTANITPTGAADVFAAQSVDSVSEYQHGDLFLEQYLDVGNTELASIPFVDEVPGEGDAAIVAEGALKPLIDTDYVTAYSQARKVAGRMKATEEALYDYGWLESAMTNTLKKKHDIARQNDILGNTNGLESIATEFNAAILGTVKITSPQYYDAIAALVAGMANSSEGHYVPNVVFVNTLDNLTKKLTKDKNDNYVMPPFADKNGNIIDGVRVVARPSIAAGSFIVGDFKNVKLRNLWGYTVRFGWENDDFSRNQITMVGESRYHLYATTNDRRGIIKGTFADVIAAITPEE